MPSYYAKYRSTNGRTLLGGVIKSQTSRFQSRVMAEDRLQQVLELNGEHCQGEVHESNLPPEIFIHCGEHAQAVGGKCPGCGKVLTRWDAVAAGGGPNLDGMDAGDLMQFWSKFHHAGPKLASELFPDRPRGYVKAAHALANYAANKATAMKCRKDGKIAEAQMYEGICGRIYEELREFARW